MSKKVFVSYCHQQGPWVWNRLVPSLRVGGLPVTALELAARPSPDPTHLPPAGRSRPQQPEA
jgi:hypothetical protein